MLPPNTVVKATDIDYTPARILVTVETYSGIAGLEEEKEPTTVEKSVYIIKVGENNQYELSKYEDADTEFTFNYVPWKITDNSSGSS